MSSLSCASWPNASAATPTRTNSCRSYARTAALPAGLLRDRIRDQSMDESCPWRGYTADAEAVAGFTGHVVQSELQNQIWWGGTPAFGRLVVCSLSQGGTGVN